MSSRFALSQFDFPLAVQCVALHPASPRDSARLLVVRLTGDRLEDTRVRDLPKILRPGDTLVINTTKVFPARLLGRRSTGGAVEVLLLHAQGADQWVCLGKGLPAPDTTHLIRFSRHLTASVLERRADGTWLLTFSLQGKAFWKEVERIGQVPIPPYLKSLAGQKKLRTSYQTVFAKQRGSAAAPTAGLHFTPKLLRELRARGVAVVPVTLHVGWGTFAPIRAVDIRQHAMHAEWGKISAASWKQLQHSKQDHGRSQQPHGRIIAVGTTALRVVEAAARDSAHQGGKWSGWTSIFLKPEDKLQMVNGLLTNFHLPKTTLFVLVCSMLGTKKAQAVYAEARRREYRWASFGDAMLILPE
ncbi:MAG: tRNA preQ1(34) S-adenosylmethionine ribosyltransferase-isomerase QueA [Patescibacteria group bacterium]